MHCTRCGHIHCYCHQTWRTLLCRSSTASLRPSGVSRRAMQRSTATMILFRSSRGCPLTSGASSSLAPCHSAVAASFCKQVQNILHQVQLQSIDNCPVATHAYLDVVLFHRSFAVKAVEQHLSSCHDHLPESKQYTSFLYKLAAIVAKACLSITIYARATARRVLESFIVKKEIIKCSMNHYRLQTAATVLA